VYQTTEKWRLLAKAGYSVITGGGRASWRRQQGAADAGGTSVGLHIHLPFEQNPTNS
jgi:predicted Rossmann-fold nucleotide-binding protein